MSVFVEIDKDTFVRVDVMLSFHRDFSLIEVVFQGGGTHKYVVDDPEEAMRRLKHGLSCALDTADPERPLFITGVEIDDATALKIRHALNELERKFGKLTT